MDAQLTQVDHEFLRHAIELSRRSLEEDGRTPFGAIVVIGGEVVGEGVSRVVELRDPTAHAEVMALRDAGDRLGTHLFEGSVMYASSEPCPMCLAACYWARVPRLVFGATSKDVAVNGFEDLQMYRELAVPAPQRTLVEEAGGETARKQAASVLQSWAARLPDPVEPKL